MEFYMPKLTKQAIEKSTNMMMDIFESSIRESLLKYLSPELAKQIFEDIFNRAKNKAVERKLASISKLTEGGYETKEEITS